MTVKGSPPLRGENVLQSDLSAAFAGSPPLRGENSKKLRKYVLIFVNLLYFL